VDGLEAASSIDLSDKGPTRVAIRIPDAWARKLGLIKRSKQQTQSEPLQSPGNSTAAAMFEEQGITVSDAVRTLLTRTANEGALPFTQANNAAAHDVWIRAKVQEALDDPRPAIAHEKVEARFARRRAAARRKV
jgi:DNA-damage-inducible protein J